jgi:hypothetical protein
MVGVHQAAAARVARGAKFHQLSRFEVAGQNLQLVFPAWGRAIAGISARATCREPTPWQASQPTSISDQVVLQLSDFGSQFFCRIVVWHSVKGAGCAFEGDR